MEQWNTDRVDGGAVTEATTYDVPKYGSDTALSADPSSSSA